MTFHLIRVLAVVASLTVFALPGRAQSCRLAHVGNDCGIGLTGALSGTTLNLTGTQPGNTSGFLILGTQALSISLPAGCLLYTDPFVSFPYSVGMSRTVTFRAAIPNGFRGRVRCQLVAFLIARPGYIIRTSRAVELTCT